MSLNGSLLQATDTYNLDGIDYEHVHQQILYSQYTGELIQVDPSAFFGQYQHVIAPRIGDGALLRAYHAYVHVLHTEVAVNHCFGLGG